MRLRQQGAVLRRRRRVRRRPAPARRAAAAITAPVDHLRPRRRRTPTSRATDIVARRRSVAPVHRRAARRDGRASTRSGRFTLGVPGRHNLLNALAAVAVGLRARRCRSTRDRRRRSRRSAAPSGGSSCAARRSGVLVVDDYGHHPTEIAAVLAAARAGHRPAACVVAFQPHRYTPHGAAAGRVRPGARGGRRGRADRHLRRPARTPIPGVTLEALADGGPRRPRRAACTSCRRSTTCRRRWRALARPGDLVITLGAGSIGTWPIARAIARGGRARVPVARARRQALPPRAREAGAPQALVDRRARSRWRAASWRCVFSAGGGYRASRSRSRRRASLHVDRHRRPRQRAPVDRRGARAARRAARREHPARRPRALARGACSRRRGSRDAALRRVLPSTVEVFVSRAAADGHRPARAAICTSSTRPAAIIDEYGPHYAEFDLPIVDGLAVRAVAASRRSTTRAPTWPRAPSRRCGATTRSAARVSQIDVSDAHDAVVLLERRSGAPAPRRRAVPRAAASRTSTSRRRCASACRRSTTWICGSTTACTCGPRGRRGRAPAVSRPDAAGPSPASNEERNVARRERYLVGLDVGTSKVTAIVGEMLDDGEPRHHRHRRRRVARHPPRRRRQPRGGGRVDQEGDRGGRADGRRRDRLGAPRAGRARTSRASTAAA